MKTLINKANPQIRITASEIRVGPDSYYLKTDGHYGFIFRKIRWALVEEEPVKEEICSKCVYHKKDDGYCYYPNGGMRRRINENGVCECTGFCEKEQENPKRKQSPALKKIVDTEEKLAKTIAEMKLEDAAESVDLEKEIDFYIGVYFLKCEDETLLNDDGDELRYTDVRKIARHFYELGRIAQIEQNKVLADMHKSPKEKGGII